MVLQLNEVVLPYKEFYGRNVDKMPELIAEGRIPMSVNGLMKRRLEVSDRARFSDEVRSAWMDNYFDTGDAVVYHPDGRVKIVLDAKPLREINPESKLNNGSLVLPDGMYEKLEGQEFTRDKLKKYVGNWLSSEEAKSNPLWRAMARDSKLLNEYVDLIFSQAKQRFGYDTTMGLYVADKPKEPQARLWFVSGLRLRSDASGWDGLHNGDGRLVGVAPEARNAAKSSSAKTLEERV